MSDSDDIPQEAARAFARGVASGTAGDAIGASALFAQALEIAPDFDAARFNLAKSLKEQGRNTDAELLYRQYLLRCPNDASALYNLANIVAQSDRPEEAADLFRKLLAIAPHFHDGWVNLALVEERLGHRDRAVDLLEQVLAAEPDHAAAHHLRRSILSKLVPHWHFTMLNDQDRNDAYERAIAAAVPGKHVLEIGAGSGILAMMAARHGAQTVTACEMSEPLAAAARRIVARNGYADRVGIVAKNSMQLEVGRDLPRKADVLIAEVFDAGLLGEGFVPALVHARAELLSEAPRLIPAKARIHALVIECAALKHIHPIGQVSGFDLSELNVFLKTGYEPIDLTNVSYQAISEPFIVAEVDFATVGLETVETEVTLHTTRAGRCHAIAFWFELDFGDGSILSSYPDKPTGHWKQAVQFFAAERAAGAGERVRLRAVRSPNGYSFDLI